jgi:hypothetical protein
VVTGGVVVVPALLPMVGRGGGVVGVNQVRPDRGDGVVHKNRGQKFEPFG